MFEFQIVIDVRVSRLVVVRGIVVKICQINRDVWEWVSEDRYVCVCIWFLSIFDVCHMSFHNCKFRVDSGGT